MKGGWKGKGGKKSGTGKQGKKSWGKREQEAGDARVWREKILPKPKPVGRVMPGTQFVTPGRVYREVNEDDVDDVQTYDIDDPEMERGDEEQEEEVDMGLVGVAPEEEEEEEEAPCRPPQILCRQGAFVLSLIHI